MAASTHTTTAHRPIKGGAGRRTAVEPDTAAATLPDVVSQLWREKKELTRQCPEGDGWGSALACVIHNRLEEIDAEVVATQPTTVNGAIDALDWAILEYVTFVLNDARGDDLIVSLLAGARAFLAVVKGGNA